MMLRFCVLLCAVGLAVGAPPAPQRTQADIDELRQILSKAKPGDGNLEEAMAERPWSSAWENSGKYQGDIILTDDQIEDMVAEYSSAEQRNGMANPNTRWPGNTIIYEFAAGHFSTAQQNEIMSSFNMFNTRTCVRFRRRTNEHDFVRITGWSDGCYAHVGYMRNFGAHTFNIAWPGCSNRMIIMHEWLHVVGFHHMHQTYPRDDWVIINWQNVQNGMASQFNRFSNSLITMLGLPYEYASNQHYGSHAFSFNGQPTITPRFNDGGQMGQLQFVSGWDILRVNRLYNCPGAWNQEVRLEDANKPAYYPYEEVPAKVSDELAETWVDAPVEDQPEVIDEEVDAVKVAEVIAY
ncbi:high choriolytic enzyme 2-like [Pectinophora gossypiella]|uniref:high choriolytic enzyme 2-like n=1 Tax=Pectinophora gossypiella TaxID=13191 RepID=UPI00214E310F|nr:high choriolytic enzyme 2-like [Pectinophora gossypiella]